MNDLIAIHVRTPDAARVLRHLVARLAESGFRLGSDVSAAQALDESPPGEENGCGIFVSGAARGWVSVWVEDWQDSGVLARALSGSLPAPVLELWVADGAHWGYTFFQGGAVQDRFADDPRLIAASPAEAALYAGRADALDAVLQVPPDAFDVILREARAESRQFPGGPVDQMCDALGLPFAHVFWGYDDFFDDDPEDYGPGLTQWPQFRHLTFVHPAGRERLSE